MTITNGALYPVFGVGVLTLIMAGWMNKLYIQPVFRIITAPVVHFKSPVSGFVTPVTALGLLKPTHPEGVSSLSSSFFFEGVANAVSGLLHALIEFDFWLLAVFVLISTRFLMIFGGGVTLHNSLAAMFGISITSLSLPALLLCAIALHSLFVATSSTGFAISRISTRLMFIFAKIGNGLWFTLENTEFIWADFGVHDYYHNTKKESVI